MPNPSGTAPVCLMRRCHIAPRGNLVQLCVKVGRQLAPGSGANSGPKPHWILPNSRATLPRGGRGTLKRREMARVKGLEAS